MFDISIFSLYLSYTNNQNTLFYMLHNVLNVRYKSPSNSLECFFYDSISKQTISCVILAVSNEIVCYGWNKSTVVTLQKIDKYADIIEKTKQIEFAGNYTIVTENDISNTTYNNFIYNKIEEKVLLKILCGVCV